MLDTLAAASAEAGDFDAAVKWQEKVQGLYWDALDKEHGLARLTLYREEAVSRDARIGALTARRCERCELSGHSRYQRADDLSSHVGQPEVATLIMVCQLAMVHTQQVKNRRLEIVDVDGGLDGVETDLVGRAHGLTGANAAAGHPDGEGVDMVVAADRASLRLALEPAPAPRRCVRARRPRSPGCSRAGRVL